MLWMKRKPTAEELRRELEAQYQSWQEQTERACRPDSADSGTDFASLYAEQAFAVTHRPQVGQGRD